MTEFKTKSRLAEARKRAGFRSAREAADKYGWAYATYASHESGTRNIPTRAAQKYAAAFHVSPEFLLFGKNPPSWAAEPDVGQPLRQPTLTFKLFSSDDAFALERWMAGESDQAEVFAISDPGNLSGKVFALRVLTDEMRAKPPVAGESEILLGDIVLIEQQSTCVPGDIVALTLPGNSKIHLRKVIARGADQLLYTPLNRNYAEFDYGIVWGRVRVHIHRL